MDLFQVALFEFNFVCVLSEGECIIIIVLSNHNCRTYLGTNGNNYVLVMRCGWEYWSRCSLEKLFAISSTVVGHRETQGDYDHWITIAIAEHSLTANDNDSISSTARVFTETFTCNWSVAIIIAEASFFWLHAVPELTFYLRLFWVDRQIFFSFLSENYFETYSWFVQHSNDYFADFWI